VHPSEIPELVVNWHLLEPCNFSCNYCFAKWDRPGTAARSPETASRILREVAQLRSQRIETAGDSFIASAVRINFAGGEPFLLKSFGSLVEEAHRLGLRVSFISNGSLISDAFIRDCAPLIRMAGFSFDASSPDVMRTIGRADRKGRTLGVAGLQSLVEDFRGANPTIRIKLNTVVCAENADADLHDVIELTSPDRWKVLRVLPVIGAEPISDDQFASFVERHSDVAVMVVEDNRDMRGSYLMIDPTGRLYQNINDGGYDYSEPIHEIGIEAALKQVGFSLRAFAARYA